MKLTRDELFSIFNSEHLRVKRQTGLTLVTHLCHVKYVFEFRNYLPHFKTILKINKYIKAEILNHSPEN